MLTVEGILALHHACMGTVAQSQACIPQGQGHIKVRHGRKLRRGILKGGMFKADGAGGYHHVSRKHIQIDTAAGTHPDKGVGADGSQLLHGNGRRGAADAGGAHGNLLPQERSGINVILPIHAYMNRIVKMLGNGLAAARVTGQEAVPPHIPFFTADVILHTNILHSKPSFMDYAYIIAENLPICKKKKLPRKIGAVWCLENYSSSTSSVVNSRSSPQLGQTMLPDSRVSSSKSMTSPQAHCTS